MELIIVAKFLQKGHLKLRKNYLNGLNLKEI